MRMHRRPRSDPARRRGRPRTSVLLKQPDRSRTSRPRIRSNVGALTQAVTAFAAIGALIFTGLSLQSTRDQNAAQNNLAAQSQYTDRYTRAVDQLGQQGADRLQIRLGGIYALERLAHDSSRDQPTLIEVLSTFVRTSSPVDLEHLTCPLRIPVDTQAALTVLSRRDVSRDNGARVDISDMCLVHANLAGASLAGANLSGARLFGADLSGAKLAGADLRYAEIPSAKLPNTDLAGANLTYANLTGSDLVNAKLKGANITDATLSGANLRNADLQATAHERTRVDDVLGSYAVQGKWW